MKTKLVSESSFEVNMSTPENVIRLRTMNIVDIIANYPWFVRLSLFFRAQRRRVIIDMMT